MGLMKVAIGSALPMQKGILDSRKFRLIMLQYGRHTWSPTLWAAVIIQYLRDTGDIRNKAGQDLFKVCLQIMEMGKTDNVFTDWSIGIIEKNESNERAVKEAKKYMEESWAAIEKRDMT
jgi:hypothetical protein